MSVHSGNALTWITRTYLENMLKNAFKDDSFLLHDFNVEPGSSVGDNYNCEIIRIECDCTIRNRRASKSIIAKAVPDTEIAEDLNKNADLLKTEVKLLSETLPLFYAELRSKTETEPFFPDFYFLDSGKKVFFMEDLKADGYRLADRKISYDLDHVLLVVKSLAEMHAASYLFFKKNPDQKNNYLDYSWKRNDGGTYLRKVIDGMGKCLTKSLDLWPLSEEDKKIFRKIKFYDLIADSYERKESAFNVLIHGDCWTNNLMFKYEDGKPVSVKFVDYQISNYNSIGLDLNQVLFTSAQEKVKLEHLEDVFETYFDAFVKITTEIEGFTIDTVRKEFVERLGFGFAFASLFRPSNISDVSVDMEAIFQDREVESNYKMYQTRECISEILNLLPMFKKYGVFK